MSILIGVAFWEQVTEWLPCIRCCRKQGGSNEMFVCDWLGYVAFNRFLKVTSSAHAVHHQFD